MTHRHRHTPLRVCGALLPCVLVLCCVPLFSASSSSSPADDSAIEQLLYSAEEQRFGVVTESRTSPHPTNPFSHPHHASLYLSTLADTHRDVLTAITLYQDAARMGATQAMHALGEIYLFGEGGITPNYTLAEQYFNRSADCGNSESQHYIGVLHSLGLLRDRDDQMAMIYEYFASTGGNLLSKLTLGYRHFYGIQAPKSCDAAYQYYKDVAEQVVRESLNSPVTVVLDKAKLSDDRHRSMAAEEDEDVIQYYQHSAENGDVSAQVALGHLYYYGARGFQQEPEKAARYFRAAAKQGDMTAVANLGQMHVQGLGVSQNNETAFQMLSQSAESGNPSAQNGLGYLYLHGQGTKQDYKQALNYFKKSADQGNADAQFNLGAMYFAGLGVDKKYATALQYFTLSSHQSHSRALFDLGTMHYHGLGTIKSCVTAVKLLKSLAERGSWSLVMNEAHRNFLKGNYDLAWMQYARAAEEGYEIAQLNSAWMLHHGYGRQANEPNRYEIAYRHWHMGAQQGNIDSLRMLGDYAFGGLVSGSIDYKNAVKYYTQAAEHRHAQAMFNLGYMHEHGNGVPVDAHLAKRYYDQAIESDAEAYVPAKLALLHLQFKQYTDKLQAWWNGGVSSHPTDATPPTATHTHAPNPANTITFTQAVSHALSHSDLRSVVQWLVQEYGRLFDNNTQLSVMELFLRFEDVLLAILCGLLAILVYKQSQRR